MHKEIESVREETIERNCGMLEGWQLREAIVMEAEIIDGTVNLICTSFTVPAYHLFSYDTQKSLF